jgi:uncharacterized protein (TIGR03118 family)
MKNVKIIHRLAGLVLTAVLPLLATPAAAKNYEQKNLVSNLSSVGATQPVDPDLLNPWGIVNPPGGPLWVSDNNAGVETLYQGTGLKVALTVTVPPPMGGMGSATPTGVVWNGTRGFVVTKMAVSGAALFIFDTEDGTISGWNSTVDPIVAGHSTANLVIDNSANDAVYKGLAARGVSGRR